MFLTPSYQLTKQNVSTTKCMIQSRILIWCFCLLLPMGWCRQCRTRLHSTCNCCCCRWGMRYSQTHSPWKLFVDFRFLHLLAAPGKYSDLGSHPDSISSKCLSYIIYIWAGLPQSVSISLTAPCYKYDFAGLYSNWKK